jgi:hypothetical protein
VNSGLSGPSGSRDLTGACGTRASGSGSGILMGLAARIVPWTLLDTERATAGVIPRASTHARRIAGCRRARRSTRSVVKQRRPTAYVRDLRATIKTPRCSATRAGTTHLHRRFGSEGDQRQLYGGGHPSSEARSRDLFVGRSIPLYARLTNNVFLAPPATRRRDTASGRAPRATATGRTSPRSA